MIENTVWLPVANYNGRYEVSNTGLVRSYAHGYGRILSPQRESQGYSRALLSDGSGNKEQRKVHQLVLETFVGPRPEGAVVRHLDGNRSNNHVDNLCWGTSSENALDTVRHGNNPQSNKTHCFRGHLFDDENTYLQNGGRVCRKCQKDRHAANYLRKKQESA